VKKSQLRYIIREIIRGRITEQITSFTWNSVHNGQGGAYLASVRRLPNCGLGSNANMHGGFIMGNNAPQFAAINAQVGDYINVVSTNAHKACIHILAIINEQDFNNASIPLPPNTPSTSPGYNTPQGMWDLTQTVPYSWSLNPINLFKWTNCNTCLTYVNGQTPGCTDTNANNYDPLADFDDGSCTYDDTYDCDTQTMQCQLNTTGTGQHQSIGACQAVCIGQPAESFTCKIDKFGNGSCTDPGDGTGQYLTLQDCQEGCVTHRANDDDREDPISFDCKVDKFGNASCINLGNGNGQYSTLQDCQAVCVGPTQVNNDDRFVDNPVNPTDIPCDQIPCNATIALSNHDPINYSGTITINFSGCSDYAYELLRPNGSMSISHNGINGPTEIINGPVLPGTYTLNYQCDVNSLSNITLPNQVTLVVP